VFAAYFSPVFTTCQLAQARAQIAARVAHGTPDVECGLGHVLKLHGQRASRVQQRLGSVWLKPILGGRCACKRDAACERARERRGQDRPQGELPELTCWDVFFQLAQDGCVFVGTIHISLLSLLHLLVGRYDAHGPIRISRQPARGDSDRPTGTSSLDEDGSRQQAAGVACTLLYEPFFWASANYARVCAEYKNAGQRLPVILRARCVPGGTRNPEHGSSASASSANAAKARQTAAAALLQREKGRQTSHRKETHGACRRTASPAQQAERGRMQAMLRVACSRGRRRGSG